MKSFPCTDDSPLNNGYGYNNDYIEPRYREPQDDEEENEIPEDSILNEPIIVINNGDINCTNDSFS